MRRLLRVNGGKYYLVYSSEQSHDLCYAVSDKPLEGFRYRGVIVSNADIGYAGNQKPKTPYGNTHGGLAEIKGQWYIFYHRQTHGIECCRQGCAEPVFLNEKGDFDQVEMTSCGLNGGPLRGIGTYSAAYACNLMHESIGKEKLTVRKNVQGKNSRIFLKERKRDRRQFNISQISKKEQWLDLSILIWEKQTKSVWLWMLQKPE